MKVISSTAAHTREKLTRPWPAMSTLWSHTSWSAVTIRTTHKNRAYIHGDKEIRYNLNACKSRILRKIMTERNVQTLTGRFNFMMMSHDVSLDEWHMTLIDWIYELCTTACWERSRCPFKRTKTVSPDTRNYKEISRLDDWFSPRRSGFKNGLL
jgi:hypothetical protein